LWRRGGAARLVAGGLGLGVPLYAIYATWGGAGWRVLGFLFGYGSEEGLDSGNGLWLLSGLSLLTSLPAWASKAYLVVVAVGLLAIGLRMMTRHRATMGSPADIIDLCGDASIMAACLTFAISPHYAWYYGWLALAATVRPSRVALWLSASPVLLYQNPFVNHFVWPALVFVPAMVLAWTDLRRAPATPRLPLPATQGST
jgi:alpha-1,6-mannosyltransferase